MKNVNVMNGDNMGCVYENRVVGLRDYTKCLLCYENTPFEGPDGSDKGFCVVYGEYNIADLCESYISDNECTICGKDLNIGDCNCR
jgi:hypothetical protein